MPSYPRPEQLIVISDAWSMTSLRLVSGTAGERTGSGFAEYMLWRLQGRRLWDGRVACLSKITPSVASEKDRSW